MHLLIPFASSGAPACVDAVRGLQLPHLHRLLPRMVVAATDAGEAGSLSPPHERALARVYGMRAPDGCIAWAAREVLQAGRDPGQHGWAWVTPVHWDVGADHITMADPQALDLPEPESRALLAAMQPFFSEDGMQLEYAAPLRWLARGALFANCASASLDRVAGRDISAWMPSAPSLRRLQNEMQMLLYTHPVNDARTSRRLATVNSFWVSATGVLPDSMVRSGPNGGTGLAVVAALRGAAVRNDWAAWADHWAQVDRNECLRLLQSLGAGEDVWLTLCGERNALTFEAARGGLLAQWRRRFARPRLQDLQELL